MRFRRGPATVTGDAHRCAYARCHRSAPGGSGRRGRVGPGARRPASDQSPQALVERGWLMLISSSRTTSVLLNGADAVPARLRQAPAASPITVNLRVEGASATVFEGPITTDGTSFATAPRATATHPCDYSENGAAGGFPDGRQFQRHTHDRAARRPRLRRVSPSMQRGSGRRPAATGTPGTSSSAASATTSTRARPRMI